MCDVWPCRYLSVGASIGTSLTGAGIGVGQREKGFDEGVSAPVEAVVLLSVLLWRDFDKDFVRLLRRKESEGRR